MRIVGVLYTLQGAPYKEHFTRSSLVFLDNFLLCAVYILLHIFSKDVKQKTYLLTYKYQKVLCVTASSSVSFLVPRFNL